MTKLLRFILSLWLCFPLLVLAQDTLVFAVDIIRHGDRTPLKALPNVDHQWPEGLGQLTARGMQQEYRMGVEFRKKYIDTLHFLPKQYEHGTIYVRSTDYERTLMSAQSLLTGLYPPGTGPSVGDSSSPALPNAIQPIPIFSAPAAYDDIIVQPINPQQQAKLLEEYVFSTPAWQQKNNALKDKYALWSQLTGVPITNLSDLGFLGDTLFIHKLHHAPMPKGLSAVDIDSIIDAGNWAFMAQIRPSEMGHAYSTKLMTNVAKYLVAGSRQQSKLKYVLLSAHDSTIASALSFLGAPLDKSPHYASNLNFALYSRDSSYYVVKISYNNSPVFVPACGGDSCELDQFVKIIA